MIASAVFGLTSIYYNNCITYRRSESKMGSRKHNILWAIFVITRYLTPIAFIVGIIYFFTATPKHNMLYLLPAIIGFITFRCAASISSRKEKTSGYQSIPPNSEANTSTKTDIETPNETDGRKQINESDNPHTNAPIKCPKCKSLDITNTYGGQYYCKECNIHNVSLDVTLKQWDWLEREFNRIRESQTGFNR
jgi:hypothetical protein